jgi:formate dehydrogenase subunit delta
MDIHHLVKMANDISAFFESEADRAKGVEGFASHLKSFWEPRMRREIFAYLDKEKGAGLSDLALTGLRTFRSKLDPAQYNLQAK